MYDSMLNYKLMILLFTLLYLLYMTIDLFKILLFGDHKSVKGCGEGCHGDCKMKRNGQLLKDLRVIFVKMNGCIHCKRLQELLDNNNVNNLITIIDSESPEVNELRNKYGEFDGFPTLISETTGKKLIGNRPNIDAIIRELS